jgi:hypothetical protein
MSSDSLKALERIASALEAIDDKLSFLNDGESNPKVRLFEDARRRIKDGLK